MRYGCARAILVLAVGCLLNCGGGDPLQYETAMNLVRERTTEPIRTSFSASPRFDGEDPSLREAYERLIDSHVIQCKSSAQVGIICEPGPAGDALAQSGTTDLSFVAGRWRPSEIVALRRKGSSSAEADVRMVFEPSDLFREFETAIEAIQAPSAVLSARKEGKTAHAVFQRYEDGWHLESIE